MNSFFVPAAPTQWCIIQVSDSSNTQYFPVQSVPRGKDRIIEISASSINSYRHRKWSFPNFELPLLSHLMNLPSNLKLTFDCQPIHDWKPLRNLLKLLILLGIPNFQKRKKKKNQCQQGYAAIQSHATSFIHVKRPTTTRRNDGLNSLFPLAQSISKK